jgi:hypothetical protein
MPQKKSLILVVVDVDSKIFCPHRHANNGIIFHVFPVDTQAKFVYLWEAKKAPGPNKKSEQPYTYNTVFE